MATGSFDHIPRPIYRFAELTHQVTLRER
jgi:hypothetical protein